MALSLCSILFSIHYLFVSNLYIYVKNSSRSTCAVYILAPVAKKLAEKLMRIDREIKDYEAAQTGVADSRKAKKGWK